MSETFAYISMYSEHAVVKTMLYVGQGVAQRGPNGPWVMGSGMLQAIAF